MNSSRFSVFKALCTPLNNKGGPTNISLNHMTMSDSSESSQVALAQTGSVHRPPKQMTVPLPLCKTIRNVVKNLWAFKTVCGFKSIRMENFRKNIRTLRDPIPLPVAVYLHESFLHNITALRLPEMFLFHWNSVDLFCLASILVSKYRPSCTVLLSCSLEKW